MTDRDTAARRIMDDLGEENRVPIVNVDEGDVYVLLGFPIGGLLLAGFTGIDALFMPLTLVGVVVGVASVYASPSHISAASWLGDVYRYYCKRPRVSYNVPDETNSVRNPSDSTTNEGGLVSYTPVAVDEPTQELTNIDRAWPGAGAVQRSDGTVEAFIEIEPGNMDFAMSGDWAQVQDAAAEFANKELEYALKFHATTRSFPVEELTDRIEDRLTDEDVTANPIFQELLVEYREQRPQELDGTQQVRYFIGVQVTPLEVYNRYRDESSPAEKLTTLPVVGFLFNPFITRRENLSDAELRAKMFEKLDRRCQSVQTELIQKVTGWSARRLSTVELFLLSMEFWNGDEHEYDDAAHPMREHQILDSQRRGGDV